MMEIRWTRISMAIAVLALGGCGPDPALLKSYVVTSPRSHVAVMTFSVADRQVDVGHHAESAFRDKLTELGYTIVQMPGADTGQTVFGPSHSAPRIEDVKAYGIRCGTPVVLVGRIERAVEGRPSTMDTYKTVQRTRREPNGELVSYDQQVVARHAQPAKAPGLMIRIKLIDTRSGREMWVSKQDPVPQEWTLEEAVQSTVEQQALDLAAQYSARKL